MYTDNQTVTVYFFKSSGKWYSTEAVKWTGKYYGNEQLIYDAFKQSLRDHFKDYPKRLGDMDAVCVEPYHEHEHPICIRNGGWNNES